jgi:hypothetical protein
MGRIYQVCRRFDGRRCHDVHTFTLHRKVFTSSSTEKSYTYYCQQITLCGIETQIQYNTKGMHLRGIRMLVGAIAYLSRALSVRLSTCMKQLEKRWTGFHKTVLGKSTKICRKFSTFGSVNLTEPGDYEAHCLLGCDAVHSAKNSLEARQNISPAPSECQSKQAARSANVSILYCSILLHCIVQ